MAVTIKDVAKKANVSTATVSRVISNNPRISEQTKQKVRKIMEEMGYHPNFQARNLVVNKTQTLGVVMANSTTLLLQNPFFPEVLRGISANAHDNKYGLYLTTGTTETEIYEEVVAMTQGRRVDGIILLYSRKNDPIMNYLIDQEFPFTLVGRPEHHHSDISFVDNDNVENARNVTRHLIDFGHERIAYFGYDNEFIVSHDRLKGYKEALAKAEIPYRNEYIVKQKTLQGNEKELLKQLIHLDEPPTALITHDDLIAYELIRYLSDFELKVPNDISIIGFNNHKISEHLDPPLSTVDISIYDLGFEATRLLINRIHQPNRSAEQIIVPSTLIKRGSCRNL